MHMTCMHGYVLRIAEQTEGRDEGSPHMTQQQLMHILLHDVLRKQ